MGTWTGGGSLTELQEQILRIIWAAEACTSEYVRLELRRPLKDSTVRTLLRRLEQRGYIQHTLDGPAFVYRARITPGMMTARLVKVIIRRYCRGSSRTLLDILLTEGVFSVDLLRRAAGTYQRAAARPPIPRRAASNQTGRRSRLKPLKAR